MSNGEKLYSNKLKNTKLLNYIKKQSPFEQKSLKKNNLERSSSYIFDYHLENESILRRSLIKKTLPINNQLNTDSLNLSLKSSSSRKNSQNSKKIYNRESIKMINDELRKSGILIGNNRKKPKRKSKLEYSRGLNRKKLSDKNLEFLRKSYTKTEYESFNDKRAKIQKMKSLEPYKFDKIIHKLKFPDIEDNNLNSYITINGKKIRKAYSMRNRDFINLVNSINSLIYNETNNEEIKNNNYNLRYSDYYYYNNNENLNIEKFYYDNIPILKKSNEEGLYYFVKNLPPLKDKTGKSLSEIIKTNSDNSTKQDFSSTANRIKNLNKNLYYDSSSSEDEFNRRKLIKREIISIENPITKEKELINIDNGKKINDIRLNINENGEEILINNETNLPIDMYNYEIDKKTGKKIFSIFEDKKRISKFNDFNDHESFSFDTINTSKKRTVSKKKNLEYECFDLELKKDEKTGKEILINKETGEKIKGLIKRVSKGNNTIFIDKKTGEQVKNIINNIDPETGEEKFIKIKPKIKDKIEVISVNKKKKKKNILINKKTGEEIKNIIQKDNKIIDEETGEEIKGIKIRNNKIIDEETGEEIKGIKIRKDNETGKDIFTIKRNSLIPKKIEIIEIKNPITGKEDLINKETKEILTNLYKDINSETGEIMVINKETGKKLENIKSKKDPNDESKEIIVLSRNYEKENEHYSNNKTNTDSIENENINNNNNIIISKTDETGKEILVNKLTGKELNEIEKTINPKTRKSILIDKETGEETEDIILKKDPLTNKEIFIIKNEDDIIEEESKKINENIPILNKEIIPIKDPRTGKEILINKETKEEIKNIKIKENPITKEIKVINKFTGKEIKNIKRIIDPKTEKEIFIEKEIIPTNEITTKKDLITGKEILVNEKTGKKIDNIEKKEDLNTGEIKLYNKETGEEIKEINKKISLETGKEIITIKKENIKPKKIEIISSKDPFTGEEKLINKNTGNELLNLEKKYDAKIKEF